MRRGLKTPADLWGSVGDFGSPNVGSTLNLIKLDIWKRYERC